ncbi:MAG: WYL domain-containing protein [Acidimicrobiales bacterium]|nr:WYL domain-containing protein [Acidimicrobiales bacterium]
MSKLERLLNLIAALLNADRPLTTEQLRERIEGYPEAPESYRRAFERDKEALRSMGIPIRTIEVPGTDPPKTGYRILREEYAGTDPQLAPDELAALHVAANLVRLEGVDGDEAVLRLGGRAADESEPSLAALPTDPNLGPLFTAATEHRTVALRYGGADRTFDPWRVSFLRGHWYVTGWDHLRSEQRLYRVDRIDGGVEVGGVTEHERPADVATTPTRLAPWELGVKAPVTARVWIEADQSPWARHNLGPEAVVAEHDDGSIEVEFEVRNPDGFRAMVLTFLDGAEVLGPPELRDEVISWLEALAEPAS